MKNYKYPIYEGMDTNISYPFVYIGLLNLDYIKNIKELQKYLIKRDTNSFKCFEKSFCIRYNCFKEPMGDDDKYYLISYKIYESRKNLSSFCMIYHNLLTSLDIIGAVEIDDEYIEYKKYDIFIKFNKERIYDKNIESEIKLLELAEV